MRTSNLAEQVISITEDYLGPVAERFINRLISFHLNKKPQELETSDLQALSEWIKVSLGLLTEDKALVDECQRRILELPRVTERI